MKNAEIIRRESMQMVEDGVLAVVGKAKVWDPVTCQKVEIPVPETIHTFKEWKDRGMSVKKGEHAVAKFAIWIPYTVTVEMENKDGEKEEKTSTKFKLKDSAFFKESQVETIEDAEKRRAEKKAKKAAKKKAAPEKKAASAPEKSKTKKSEKTATAPKDTASGKKKTTKKSKNPYKSIIQMLHKSTLKKNAERLFIQRNSKIGVDISNGHVLLRLGLHEYREHFIGSHDYYKDLKEGELYTVFDKDNIAEGKPIDFAKIYRDAIKNEKPVTVTDYATDGSSGKFAIRGLICDGKAKGVQVKYLDGFGTDRKWYSNGEVVTPIWTNDGIDAVILPVNVDDEFREAVKNAAK